MQTQEMLSDLCVPGLIRYCGVIVALGSQRGEGETRQRDIEREV